MHAQCTLTSCSINSVTTLQYVFAITEGEDFIQGGELWRSDRYGAADSWKNMTDELEGKRLALCMLPTLIIVQQPMYGMHAAAWDSLCALML